MNNENPKQKTQDNKYSNQSGKNDPKRNTDPAAVDPKVNQGERKDVPESATTRF